MKAASKQLIVRHAHALRAVLEIENSSDLSGLCLEASSQLKKTLKLVGINARLVSGKIQVKNGFGQHYWLEYSHNVIDITGDQFNPILGTRIPKVLVRQRSRCKLYCK